MLVSLSACSAMEDGADDGARSDETGEPGSVVWAVKHGLDSPWSPLIGRAGRVFLHGTVRDDEAASGGDELIAFEPDGTVRWTAPTNPGFFDANQPLMFHGDEVIAPMGGVVESESGPVLHVGRLNNFLDDDGEPLGAQLTAAFPGTVALTKQGAIVAPSISIEVFRFGEPFAVPHPLPLEKSVWSNAAIGPSGTFYAGIAHRGSTTSEHPDGAIGAFRIEDDTVTQVWELPTTGQPIHALSIDREERIYTVTFLPNQPVSRLHAISADGELLWTFDLAKFTSGVVVDASGVVYVNASDGVHAIKDGELVWKTQVGPSANVGVDFRSMPALSDAGTLYVNGSCGIAALEASTGEIVWTRGDDCEANYASPTIGDDGTIYVTTRFSTQEDTHTLYALVGDGTGVSTTAPWPCEQANAAHTGRVDP